MYLRGRQTPIHFSFQWEFCVRKGARRWRWKLFKVETEAPGATGDQSAPQQCAGARPICPVSFHGDSDKTTHLVVCEGSF